MTKEEEQLYNEVIAMGGVMRIENTPGTKEWDVILYQDLSFQERMDLVMKVVHHVDNNYWFYCDWSVINGVPLVGYTTADRLNGELDD